MFNQLVHEPTFNVLRTQEQLGYIVDSAEKISPGTMGFRVLVQSEKDPVYVETRIETFLDGMKAWLEELSDEEFEKNRNSLILKKEEKPKNLGEETRRFWGVIADQTYEFGKRMSPAVSLVLVADKAFTGETDVINLKAVTKQDVIDLLMSRIHTSSTTRSKLSTHMRSQYTGIKFDSTSAQPLIESFTKHTIVVDQAALGKLMQSQPDLQTVKDFAKAAVAKADGLSEESRKEVEGVIEGLKGIEAVKAGGDVKLRESNVFIEDIHAFKAGLLSSKAPVAVEPVGISAKL
jgi:insulysin